MTHIFTYWPFFIFLNLQRHWTALSFYKTITGMHFKPAVRFWLNLIYRVARSRLTHFKFEYFAGAIACRGWLEWERKRRGRPFIWSVAMEHWKVQQRDNWVRSVGDIAWPARSPDLTLPDVFLWGFLKDRVFRRRTVTIQELKQTVVDEAAAIDEDLRRRVYGNFQTRLQQCIALNGGRLPGVQKISL